MRTSIFPYNSTDMKWLCVFVLSFKLFVNGQYSSPCPGIFDYEPGVEENEVHGKIPFQNAAHSPVESIELRINFTANIDGLKDKYRGHLESPSGSDLLRLYNEGNPITYRIHFPVMSPLPQITALIVNGEVICYAPRENSGADRNLTWLSLCRRSSCDDTVDKPVTSTPEPVVTTTSTPRSVITARINYRFSRTLITKDECGVVDSDNEMLPSINNDRFYERGEMPWLVAIYRDVNNIPSFICGGTLVSDRHVITAAHCIQHRVPVPISEIVVKVGGHSLNDWSDGFTVTTQLMAAAIHEEYNPETLENDIAVLTLYKSIKFNRYSRPACLWSGDTELSNVVGATGIVAGLRAQAKGYFPIVSTNECRASNTAFHFLTNNNTLCAGDRSGMGPCTGDSGGGLYLLNGGKWRLRGVVSVYLRPENGDPYCNLNEYIVFTDTAQFLPWIRNILST